MTDLFDPLALPNGAVLPNRICKAAMEENLAEAGQVPGAKLFNLYRRWAEGGAGLILTGNVMIDPTAMTGAGGVVLQRGTLDDAQTRHRFEDWAAAGKAGGAQLWMQISHPGRQVYAAQGTQPVSASATKVTIPGFDSLFDTARALTGDEICGIVTRFAETAQAAEAVGFDGVQIHAAHGYLIAQFLSPLTNLREDEWGGSLENRARLLLEVVRAVRARVGQGFAVAVKLNSADFQRGGFDETDAARVVDWLNAEDIDLLELSGGNYESSAMMGHSEDGRIGERASSTALREMYFFDFADRIAGAQDGKGAAMPVMVTGGVTKLATARAAVASPHVDVVGIARAMAYRPDLPKAWARGEAVEVPVATVGWKNKGLASLATMGMTKANLDRMGDGAAPKAKPSAIGSLIRERLRARSNTKRYKRWLEGMNA